MTAHPPGPRLNDTGMQLERTMLAWQRTVLVALADGSLLLRTALRSDAWWAAAIGVPLCAGAIAVGALAAVVYRRGGARSREGLLRRSWLAVAAASSAAAVGMTAGVLALSHP